MLGPSLADPKRPATDLADGGELADLFDSKGLSRVAGRAAAPPGLLGRPRPRSRNATTPGGGAVVVDGRPPARARSIWTRRSAVPVVSVPSEAAGRAGRARSGEVVSVEFGRARRVANGSAGRIAAFSSGGVAFDGRVKPDLVAPGVGLATADGGSNVDGSPRYATVTGSSASAAVVAGAAAVLAQARPGLTATELRSLLVGSAQQIVLAADPRPGDLAGCGLPRPTRRRGSGGRRRARDARLRPRGPRRLARHPDDSDQKPLHPRARDRLRDRRDHWGDPELAFSATPANLALLSGATASVTLVASASGPLEGEAGGSFVVAPQGSRAIRVPWAVSFRPEKPAPLLGGLALEQTFAASDAAPAVVAFRAGNVASDANGHSVEPVELLVAELWTADGNGAGRPRRAPRPAAGPLRLRADRPRPARKDAPAGPLRAAPACAAGSG